MIKEELSMNLDNFSIIFVIASTVYMSLLSLRIKKEQKRNKLDVPKELAPPNVLGIVEPREWWGLFKYFLSLNKRDSSQYHELDFFINLRNYYITLYILWCISFLNILLLAFLHSYK